MMKTLADFKRRLTPGTKLVWSCYATTIKGNTGDTVLPGRVEGRTVEKVTSSQAVFLRPDGQRSYLQWPKAKECVFHADGEGLDILNEYSGKINLTYRFSS